MTQGVSRRRKITQSNYGERPHRGWGLGLVFGGLLLFAIVVFLLGWLFRPYYYSGAPTMPYYGGWFFFPFFFPFGFIFFIFIVLVLSRLLFWPWGWRRGYWHHHDEAADILRQRYARGEITKDQFTQMMRDLEQRS